MVFGIHKKRDVMLPSTPSPVTLCHKSLTPTPSERDILYGRPHI